MSTLRTVGARALCSNRASRLRRVSMLAAAASAMLTAGARASVLTQWAFQGDTLSPTTLDANMATVPSLSALGGITPGFASGNGSSDPIATGGRSWQTTTYAAQQTANKSRGIQIALDTSNFTVDSFQFDWRTSNSSGRHIQLQYNLDAVHTSDWVDAQLFTSAGGDTWNNLNIFDLTTIPGASNNATFALRLVGAFSPTEFTANSITYPANSAYQPAGTAPTQAYAPTGTWRFDMITLSGAYVPPVFTPKTLTWNDGNGNWDTQVSNKPWLDQSANPSSFAQSSGQGDNVIFSNPPDGSLITVDAAGVTPNSIVVNNSGTLTFTGGPIGGTGGLQKSGSGRLILAATNTFTSAQTPTQITNGILETRANNPLGGGLVTLTNTTWNSTGSAHSSAGPIFLSGVVVFDTQADLNLSATLTGSGEFIKQGNGTLGLASIGSNTGKMTINAGTVRLDNIGALGGNATNDSAAPELSVNNSTVILNATGTSGVTRARLSGKVTLNNALIERNQLTPLPGASTTNGDSEFTSYTTTFGDFVGGHMLITGNTTLRNLETRTADSNGLVASNVLAVRMPIQIASGATLTLEAVNNHLSVSGSPAAPHGSLDNTAVGLRTSQGLLNLNDSVTIEPGGALAFTGAGQKRLGSDALGKPIVGLGTTAVDAAVKLDDFTFIANVPTGVSTHLVVSGSGLGGLRVEAPMNAVYVPVPDPFNQPEQFAHTGLFGVNTTETYAGQPADNGPEIKAIANSYTVMNPSRWSALSGFDESPTQSADGLTTLVRGGTLTLAATNATGAIGLVDNGPAQATPIKLGLDNAPGAGTLVYEIDASANSEAFTRFSGLVVRQSNAGPVTASLLANATMAGTDPAATTFDQLGGTLDLNGFSLTVGAAATLHSGTLAAAASPAAAAGPVGNVLAAGSVVKVTGGVYTIDPGATIQSAGAATISAGTLLVHGTLDVKDVTGAGELSVGGDGGSSLVLVDHVRTDTLTIGSGGVVSIRPNGGNAGASVVNHLNFAGAEGGWEGTLDLADNDLIIHATSLSRETVLAAVTDQIRSSRNAAPELWQGNGIKTSIATSDSLTGLGVILNDNGSGGALYTEFSGQPVDQNSVLVKYTWNGDLDLNGGVNADDYFLIDSGFASGSTGYHNGDIDYSGTIDADDYFVIDSAFAGQTGSLSAAVAVPEPASVLAAIAGLALLRRRRKV